MRIIIALMLFVFSITLPGAAQAQNWWDKARNILNSSGATQTIPQLPGNTGTITNSPNLSAAGLSNLEIASGLREALSIGTQNVVGRLGTTDGFNLDPKIHIPLPATLQRVDQALGAVGMNSLTADLETRLNRAAEMATPKAKALFIDAISQMTIDDARSILTGPNDAATQFLRRTMGPGLAREMGPIVGDSLAGAGAIQAYDQVMGQYSQIPFMPNVKANLNDYVVGKAMDGIFYYVGQEEAAIRANPAKRSTDLLKKVFSAL